MQPANIVNRVTAVRRDGYIIKCLTCGTEVYKQRSIVESGNGKYCSSKCVGKAQSIERKGKRKGEELSFNCANCGTKVTLLKSEYKARYRLQGAYPKYCSRACANKGNAISGKENPNWNRILCVCQFCGKNFYKTPSQIANGRGKFCSKSCLAKSKTSERNGFWKGGISQNPYPLEFNEELREYIRKRDDYMCQICNVPQENLPMYELGKNRSLDVHHVNYDKDDNSYNNLVSLCASCHGGTGTDREFWKKFFTVRMHNQNGDYEVGEQLLLFWEGIK